MKKKLFWAFWLALMLSAVTGMALAERSGTWGAEGDNITWTLSDEGVMTISGQGEMADFDEGMDADENPWAYLDIHSVVVEEGVTSLGTNAFDACVIGSNIQSIDLPDSLTSISSFCFANQPNLESIEIPDSVKTIHWFAFVCCESLKSIQIPDGVVRIEDSAFGNCTSLRRIELPDSLTYIADLAFDDIPSDAIFTVHRNSYAHLRLKKLMPQAQLLVWDEGTCGIDGGDNLTWRLENTDLTISGTGEMQDYSEASPAPWGTDILTVTIGEGVTSIGAGAFMDCNQSASFTIPASVKSIGENAFAHIASRTTFIVETNNSYARYWLSENLPDAGLRVWGYGACGENLTWTMTDEGVLTISGQGEMANYEDVDTAFYHWYKSGNDYIDVYPKAVIIEEGVTSIGSYAFFLKRSIENIELPDSLTSINCLAFSGCIHIKSLRLPKNLTYIDGSIFADNDGFETICVVDRNTYAHQWVLDNDQSYVILDKGECGRNQDNLTWSYVNTGTEEETGCTLTISGNGEMADYSEASPAPWGTDILTVTIGEGVTSIGAYAFKDCALLESIALPASLSSIDAHAFDGIAGSAVFDVDWGSYAYSWLKSNLPNAVIRETDKYNCGKEGANLHWSLGAGQVLTITGSGEMADYSKIYSSVWGDLYTEPSPTPWGTDITAVIIGDGVTSVGACAFYGCNRLERVELPYSLTSIGEHAFDGIAEGAVFTVCRDTYAHTWVNENLTGVTTDVYTRGTCGANDGDNVIWTLKDGHLTISGTGEMDYCTVTWRPWGTGRITSVTVGEGVTNVGEFAFYACHELTDVQLPSTLTRIDDDAFSNCSALERIQIPEGVTSIGYAAFNGCNLIGIYLPETLQSIDSIAFRNCEKARLVILPSGLTSIGEDAFAGLPSDANFVVTRGTYAHNWALENIAPENIGFRNSGEVNPDEDGSTPGGIPGDENGGSSGGEGDRPAAWQLDDGILTIKDNSAMADCTPDAPAPWGTDITAVILRDGVTEIAGNAFAGCEGLTRVILPATLARIGENAFANTAPTDILYSGTAADRAAMTIASGNEALTSAAWQILDDLAALKLPAGLTVIEAEAFSGIPAKKLEIPATVRVIGARAFASCAKLCELSFAGDVQSIAENALEGCGALVIRMPEGCENLEALAAARNALVIYK